MPVDPSHEYADQAHASTVDNGRPYTCKDRPPVAPFVTEFQDGWTEDGRRNMVKHTVEFKQGVNCGHVGLESKNKDNDPKCRGCRWSSLK